MFKISPIGRVISKIEILTSSSNQCRIERSLPSLIGLVRQQVQRLKAQAVDIADDALRIGMHIAQHVIGKQRELVLPSHTLQTNIYVFRRLVECKSQKAHMVIGCKRTLVSVFR